MRIGLISDIHSNLPALEATLEAMPPVDTVVCAGDIVGYNPWPGACLERVREVASVSVQGNHDRNVETPHRYEHNEMACDGLQHAKKTLTDEQREWLVTLSPQAEIADGQYLLVHSHPDPEKRGRYVRPRDFPRMRPYLDDYNGIILGHTHIQHEAVIDGRLVINPGSVGQPRDGNSQAAFAVLDTALDEVECYRVGYDINRVITRVEEVGLPVKTATRLLEGK